MQLLLLSTTGAKTGQQRVNPPGFAEYQRKTARKIPLVILHPSQ